MEKKGKPLNRGWRIAKEELIAFVLGNQEELNMYSVIIDVTPSRKTEVNLLELLDIYVYTYGDKKGEKAQWSNLMLRTREIFWGPVKSEQYKTKLTKEFPFQGEDEEDIFTFLYLHGEENSWNFGRLGQMNAALIYKEAKDFFRDFFR